MPTLKVSSFYLGSCETKKSYREKVKDKTRFSVLYKAIRVMTEGFRNGIGKDRILDGIRKLFEEEYELSWFSSQQLHNEQIEDDIVAFSRYIDFTLQYSFADGCIDASFNTGRDVLTCNIPVVFEKDGEFFAHLIFPKKADKSPAGKSVHTCSDTDLYALVSKGYLEEFYGNIHVCLVYLFNQDDVSSFVVTGTKKSNIFDVSFKAVYDEGSFNRELLKCRICDVMSHPVRPDCFNCNLKELCSSVSADKGSHAMPKSTYVQNASYVMPSFTAEQQKIISHKEGPLLVCACPGSGKTASLVGWMKARVDEGIPPEFILAVTFTRDAAGEIRDRCLSFCSEEEMPYVTTLNAFCYRVLKDNEDVIGKVKLLSQMEKLEIIDELLDGRAPMRGFSYAQKKGKTGLLRTIERRMDELSVSGQDQFAYEHPDMGRDFFSFADEYDRLVKESGFITFDEQISLCLKLFKEHPDILDSYQHLFKYVLVDEYQDVNRDQANLVYLLAKEHQNIIAIGDDDQSIYAFRGGSNKYMLMFPEVYKGAETIVLKENFRSTEPIVEASRLVIQKNKNRIDKAFEAVRKEGKPPVYMEGTSSSNVNMAVKSLIDEGFGYGDIAVLSSKNSTLEILSKEADFPNVLGKSFLVNEPSFRILSDILSLYFDGISDSTLFSYFHFFGEEVESGVREYYEHSDSKAVRFLKGCMEDIEKDCSVLYLTDKVFSYFDQIDTAVDEALGTLIDEKKISSVRDLKNILQFMTDYGDDTRLMPDTSSSVLLSTSHESKGLEWKCVIMIDDFKKDGTDESNRLYYVAMTRAKDRLYILRDNYNSGEKTA